MERPRERSDPGASSLSIRGFLSRGLSIGQKSSRMNINLLQGSWFQALAISAESSDLEQGHGRPRWVYWAAAAYGGSGQSFHPSLLQMIILGCLSLHIILIYSRLWVTFNLHTFIGSRCRFSNICLSSPILPSSFHRSSILFSACLFFLFSSNSILIHREKYFFHTPILPYVFENDLA